ncbi:fatty acid-binding protein 2-like [Hyposmocoma kahamanoa]|uniref:fatty acid-binding protein 2-like n=1 Tax=Hyposmocoma kahamanoa TaxID=1477025 RepID=UPI000E6DA505|nr:fatty acid-binding protein 2-like [Hyposmocoma kahamanoa]
MAYFGKEFVLDRQENFTEFIESLKMEIPPEIKKAVINSKSLAKIDKNGDEYTLSSVKVDGSTSSRTFKSGVEYEETNFGRTGKAVITVDGDTFTQVQKYPEGTLTTTRKFSPNELVVTITFSGWDGEAKRYYKAK